jgi:hypothetical protein
MYEVTQSFFWAFDESRLRLQAEIKKGTCGVDRSEARSTDVIMFNDAELLKLIESESRVVEVAYHAEFHWFFDAARSDNEVTRW